MNSILKKIVSQQADPAEIANLLEKHLGTEDNEYWCDRAIVAIRNIRIIECRSACLRTIRLLGSDYPSCQTIRTLIVMLRSGNIELIQKIDGKSE